MLVSVKNLTAQNIADLGLGPLETKVVYYNRPFFWGTENRQTIIRQLIRALKIVFLDEFGQDLVYAGPGDTPEQREIINDNILADMIISFNSVPIIDDYSVSRAERQAGIDIGLIIGSMWRKLNKTVQNFPVSRNQVINKLNTAKITEFVQAGFLGTAGTAINGVAADDFFTAERKLLLENMYKSVKFD